MNTDENKKVELSKVTSRNFTTEELEELWKKHNETLQELEIPAEKYTRFTSDLIKSLRDVSENLILAGAIPEASSIKDTASYVWKKMKERNIVYPKAHFYDYFTSEQKRDWQTGDPKEDIKVKHKHTFTDEEIILGMGNVARCDAPCDPKCFAILLDGKLYEQQELQEKEPELKPTKEKSSHELENKEMIHAYERVITRLKSIVKICETTSYNFTKEEKDILKFEMWYMNKSTEFVDMSFNRKNLIDPLTQHLLSVAYSSETQNHAGGKFLMERIDLAQRRHGESVKWFKKAGEFAKLLSGKQTAKAMRGKIRILNQRYEPQNEKEAMDAFFSGQQCSNCKHWRVGDEQVLNHSYKEGDPVHEKYDTKLICFHCNMIQKKIHFKLPKQSPPVTIDYSKDL